MHPLPCSHSHAHACSHSARGTLGRTPHRGGRASTCRGGDCVLQLQPVPNSKPRNTPHAHKTGTRERESRAPNMVHAQLELRSPRRRPPSRNSRPSPTCHCRATPLHAAPRRARHREVQASPQRPQSPTCHRVPQWRPSKEQRPVQKDSPEGCVRGDRAKACNGQRRGARQRCQRRAHASNGGHWAGA